MGKNISGTWDSKRAGVVITARSRLRQGSPLFVSLFYFVLVLLSNATRQEQIIKGIRIGKKEINPYLLMACQYTFIIQKKSIMEQS